MLDEAYLDEELQQEMARLGSRLHQLDAQRPRPRNYSFLGQDSVTLEEALDLMERISSMELLEKQLRKVQHGEGLSNDRNSF